MKSVLLGSSALICIGLAASPAFAACTSTSPTTGQTVDCTGSSSTPVTAGGGQTNVTVNLQDGSNLAVVSANAVRLLDNSTINLQGNAVASTTGAGGIVLGIFGSHGTITLNGTAQANTTGAGISSGAVIFGTNGNMALRDDSGISTTGNGALGAAVIGDNGSLSLSGNALIQTSGTTAYGVEVASNNGLLTLSDHSRIITSNTSARGAALIGDNAALVMTGYSSVTTTGSNADDIFFSGNADTISLGGRSSLHSSSSSSKGIYGLGDGNTVTLAGNSSTSNFGLNAAGVKIVGNRDLVRLSGYSAIQTQGNSADAIELIGTNESILVTGGAQISTNGLQSHGAYIQGDYGAITFNNHTNYGTIYGSQSVGAYIKGNHGTITLNGPTMLATIGSASDGARLVGDSGSIALGNSAWIYTGADTANGAVTNGSHDTITLNDDAHITTLGIGASAAYGIGTYNTIVFNDRSHVLTNGLTTSATGFHGDHNRIVLNGTSTIVTAGSGAGIRLNGNYNSAILQDQSSVRASGALGYGVLLEGTHNTLVVNQLASIVTTGASAPAVVSQGGALIENLGTISSASGPAILGDNNAANIDTLINFGRIRGGGGTAIDLQAGDDVLDLSTGSDITGSIDGGAGFDVVQLGGSGSEDDQFLNFERLDVLSTGSWALSGNSTFSNSIRVIDGRLAVNGTLTSPLTTIGAAGILGGNGTLNSNVTSTGTIAPGNSVGTLTINGNFTQTGGAFDVQVDRNGVDRLNVLGAGGATLASGPTLNILPQGDATGGAGIILHAPNGITGSFGTITYHGNGAADVTQTATDISLITVDGTPVVGSAFAASETGLDYLDSVNDEQLAGLRSCNTDSCDRAADQRFHLWAKGFGRFGNEAAEAGNQGFNYRIAGSALGGDMSVADGLRLGVSFGYSNTDETLAHNAADADIDTTQAALYANYQKGPYFVTGLVSGGWQHFDQSRQIGGRSGGGLAPGSNGNGEADSTTNGWLFGSSLQAGAQFRFPKGWMLTPSAGVSYQHQWINGTSEHGGGAADVNIASHQADALRLKAQLVLSQDYELTGYTITPHLKLGVQQQYNLGGRANGSFSDGTDFTLDLLKTDRTIGLAGVGIDVAFDNGFSTYVDYDGALASGRTVHAVTGGLRYSW